MYKSLVHGIPFPQLMIAISNEVPLFRTHTGPHTEPILRNVSQDRKKLLYAIQFLIFRDEKWIEPYLSNITNQDSNHLLRSWNSFESQLFTPFGHPNEVRKAEAGLDSLTMK
ncbi:hypothetical protein O181_098437 [Austropuccinia psidii MF-1]|uniref:Uncharacterized protein n=1 Tax=Austropuccinia psidii MF-1 TaxID=1389203 RepID=A0A9Q3JB86_9BASI|nr:hypothetical protein [Austropuccinia psidii MF-1]